MDLVHQLLQLHGSHPSCGGIGFDGRLDEEGLLVGSDGLVLQLYQDCPVGRCYFLRQLLVAVGEQPHVEFLLEGLPASHNRDLVALLLLETQLLLTAKEVLQQLLLIRHYCLELVAKPIHNPHTTARSSER
jgi:hypothetical protein